MTMPEDNNMLLIEGMDENAVGITLLNLAAEGSDGIAALRNLINNDPSAPFILMIPEDVDNPEIIVEAVRAGARAYIKKPASAEEVTRRLDKLLRRGDKK
jgi:DNA-binding NarL/FixJ family response regulator